MPNRIIKESIKRSPTIDKLKPFEEVVFYRMIVTADDYGRLDGRAVVLKNELFPTKEDITKKCIEDAITQLVYTGLVRRYEVDGRPFLYMPTWELHQRVRNSKKRYPDPPQEVSPQFAASCGELPQKTAVIQSNPNPNPNPIQRASGGFVLDDEFGKKTKLFEAFWVKYPRHQGRNPAERIWSGLVMGDELFEKIMSSLEKQKKSEQWTKDNGKFIPNAEKWLAEARWEDDLSLPDEKKVHSGKEFIHDAEFAKQQEEVKKLLR